MPREGPSLGQAFLQVRIIQYLRQSEYLEHTPHLGAVQVLLKDRMGGDMAYFLSLPPGQ